jgi:hypothetical protein
MPDDIHFTNPPTATACPRSVQRHRRPAPHRLDFLPGCRWPFEPGALQLLHAFNYIPPIIGFSSVGRKDSLNNIEQTGEFAWNLATRPLAEQMNQSCAMVGPEVNEFELSGLTPVASKSFQCHGWPKARCPSSARSRRSFSCSGPTGNRAELADSGRSGRRAYRQVAVEGRVYDTAAAEPILRGGGPADYFQLGPEALFKMYRPGAVR